MTKPSSPPAYRHQKSSNLAVVRIHGKDYYLGEYGSSASRQLYAQLIAEKGADSPEVDTARLPATQKIWSSVDELSARFMTSGHLFLREKGSVNPSKRPSYPFAQKYARSVFNTL